MLKEKSGIITYEESPLEKLYNEAQKNHALRQEYLDKKIQSFGKPEYAILVKYLHTGDDLGEFVDTYFLQDKLATVASLSISQQLNAICTLPVISTDNSRYKQVDYDELASERGYKSMILVWPQFFDEYLNPIIDPSLKIRERDLGSLLKHEYRHVEQHRTGNFHDAYKLITIQQLLQTPLQLLNDEEAMDFKTDLIEDISEIFANIDGLGFYNQPEPNDELAKLTIYGNMFGYFDSFMVSEHRYLKLVPKNLFHTDPGVEILNQIRKVLEPIYYAGIKERKSIVKGLEKIMLIK